LRRPGAIHGLPPALQALRDRQQTRDPMALQRAPAGLLYFVEAEMLDVSASEVRQRVRNGADAASLLVPAVWTYITERQLYRGIPY
jgi:nicotinate-nucleotide adenylyltransferase